ncbi:MAG: hypothetical protein C0591_05990 [Marinilabiliales bacterium]|nr:MAG: hypothetical protein C0591_05990 [Marinilabiliales bacterium]
MKKAKKSRLSGIPAWALSILTLVALIIVMSIFHDPFGHGDSTFEIIGYIVWDVLITTACFIICKTHPKSVWYTPVICNAVGIASVIVPIIYPEYWPPLSEWIFWISSIVLSVSGAIVGAIIGRRKLDKQNN